MGDVKEQFKLDSTLFIGFNPGFGSGYAKLLLSWALDLVFLINLGYKLVFTQANDFSDLRGETRVFDKLFDKKVNVFLPPSANPYRAMTTYVDENVKTANQEDGVWCSANTHLYGLQGWKYQEPDGQISRKQIVNYMSSREGKQLTDECFKWANRK